MLFEGFYTCDCEEFQMVVVKEGWFFCKSFVLHAAGKVLATLLWLGLVQLVCGCLL